MLSCLSVRDFAIIESVDVEPAPGLTVLTGETGAGKSIVVGALQLLLGERAAADQVRRGAPRTRVEGTFRIEPEHPATAVLDELGVAVEQGVLLVRRDVSAEGRSRAYLNDVAVTMGSLRRVGELLVDLHGQHEHQSLLRPAEQLSLLDAWAGLEADRARYRAQLDQWHATRAQLEVRERAALEFQQRSELARFQLSEIETLDPREGEEESLEAELRLLEGAERLIEETGRLAGEIEQGDQALLDHLRRIEKSVHDLADIDPRLADLTPLAQQARVALAEMALRLARTGGGVENDPQRLRQLKERHSALISTARRYGGTVAAMRLRREELRTLLEQERLVDTQRDQLATEAEQQRHGAAQAALELSRARQEAATGLARRIEQELHGLAMPQARVRIEVAPREHEQGWIERGNGIRYEGGPTGMDRVTFWLGTNPGAELLPLQRVASGGEISRIMLALKSVLGRASRVPTLIFDEIDAGIGGRTADRVGECLVALAQERQVIVITHLPQIARRGSRHLVVDKQLQQGRAQTCIRAVEGKQRQEELAVLMGAPGAAILPVERS